MDLASVYPKQLKKVEPDVIIQFDYFHIVKIVYWYLKNAIKSFRVSLKKHLILEYLMKRYKATLIEKVLIFKEQVRDIFNLSQTS